MKNMTFYISSLRMGFATAVERVCGTKSHLKRQDRDTLQGVLTARRAGATNERMDDHCWHCCRNSVCEPGDLDRMAIVQVYGWKDGYSMSYESPITVIHDIANQIFYDEYGKTWITSLSDLKKAVIEDMTKGADNAEDS